MVTEDHKQESKLAPDQTATGTEGTKTSGHAYVEGTVSSTATLLARALATIVQVARTLLRRNKHVEGPVLLECRRFLGVCRMCCRLQTRRGDGGVSGGGQTGSLKAREELQE
jgi:hypothetical protein